ncbi:MAG TPA: zinc ribbon domain-containing protein [Vicinamibacterales bacterium]|jgi:hypothetical protein|nr:zinc ribbon domain-containing protein [Vicinamibacterales bacterium]
MSSAISTDAAETSPDGLQYRGSSEGVRHGSRPEGARNGRSPLKNDHAQSPSEPSFQPWHFFVLLSLIAATVAVLVSRQNAPAHLVLISLTIGAAGAAAFACYRTVAPLSSRVVDATEPLSDSLRADLEREKALTLRSIKELEFDRAMGKLSNDDFAEMSRRLRTRAVGIMKQLDEGADYRPIIERELAARTAKAAPRRAAGMCACGTRNDADARFCKSCGSRLGAA